MSNGVIWSPGMTLATVEKSIILKAYSFYNKNKEMTARSLGIAVNTLNNKFDKYAEEIKAQEELLNDARRKREDFLHRCRNGGPSELRKSERRTIYDKTDEGVRVESVAHAPAQSAMPVSQREEIQKMLPNGAPRRGPGRPRKAVQETNGRA